MEESLPDVRIEHSIPIAMVPFFSALALLIFGIYPSLLTPLATAWPLIK